MKAFDQINVIPFIDIMLVLLTIVLTTATFVSQGLIKVTLPEADTAKTQITNREETFEITINASQQIYFSGKLITADKLEQLLQTVNKNTTIILRVDKAVRFEKFVQLVDLLKKYKLEKLTILTLKHSPT